MNSAIKEAYGKVVAEEKRLLQELAKIRSVKAALEEAGQPGELPRKKAPAGTLGTYILDALRIAGRPLNNSELRDLLREGGYKFSLKPIHVGKTLAQLLADKKVKREGKNSGAKYTLAKKA